MWQGFQGIGGQAGLPRAPAPRFVIPAPHFVMPAPHFVIPVPPHFVIPAKAGIQRGGEECGKASRVSEAKPTFPRAPAPRFVIPAPHFVIPAKAGIQRGGEGRIRHGGPSLNAAPKLLPHP